ncbi:NPCBM/NEW2 domain protein [Gimesia alba]|uniref:NPCBM/NEW2 domain protein n=1 Tax=Gimesia alba TaxID=2527973 RepID=A0A517RJT6_9PLAN|nr:NPCBM/NEW2 domain-containing protein [Gimesia alba]QDT44136.1 NPCBM/NEW2 domain protein [Gimesia alba]
MLSKENLTGTRVLLAVLFTFGFLVQIQMLAAGPSDQKIDFTVRYKELLLESQKAPSKQYLKEVAFDIIEVCEQAIQAGDYSAALKFAAFAVNTAKRSGNNHAFVVANGLKQHSSALLREYRKVEKYQQKLEKNPNDSQSAFHFGRFLALRQHDWRKGLFWLSKGDDVAYRTLAQKELSNPKDERSLLTLAAGWSQLAEKESGLEKQQLVSHSYELYQRAWSRTLGTDRARISNMMSELPIRYLNHMPEQDVIKGPWPLGKDGDCGSGKGRFTVNEMEFPNGLGLHPPTNGAARVRYELDGQYKTFVTGVALRDSTYNFTGTVYFSVIGDGNLLWKSVPVRARGDVQYCSVSVKDVNKLELRVECPGKSTGAHAVWLNPHVLKY